MKHNIIKTDNYLLVVDDSEIKVDDFMYFWNGQSDSIHKHKEGYVTENIYGVGLKIIAHLPLNNSPILEAVPLLPPLGDGVFEEANELSKKEFEFTHKSVNEIDFRVGFNAGYTVTKEKYKFTEKDMVKAMDLYKTTSIPLSDIIQSLSQPKTPTHFEFETVCDQCLDDDSVDSCYCHHGSYKIVPKTLTNSQGQIQVVGRYIYE